MHERTMAEVDAILKEVYGNPPPVTRESIKKSLEYEIERLEKELEERRRDLREYE